MTVTYVSIEICRPWASSWASRVSCATIVSTSATFPPASFARVMIETTRWTSGVGTRSWNRRSAVATGTPHSSWLAIFLISSVSRPYRPLLATTIASGSVMPKRPASATSRRKSGSRSSILEMRRSFALIEKPYGAMRTSRPRTMKSSAGFAPAPSPGRIWMLSVPTKLSTPMSHRTIAPASPAIRSAVCREIVTDSLVFTSELVSAFTLRTDAGGVPIEVDILHLLRDRVHEENEPELGERDHQADDRPQHVDHERPAAADDGEDRDDDHEEQRERHHDGHERLGEQSHRLDALELGELVLPLVLLGLEEEIRFQLAAAGGRGHDPLEEILEPLRRAARGAVPDRGQDVDPEEFRVAGDPRRLFGDLPVDLLPAELLEDLVDVHVGRRHRADEAHRGADLPVDVAPADLRLGAGRSGQNEERADRSQYGERDGEQDPEEEEARADQQESHDDPDYEQHDRRDYGRRVDGRHELVRPHPQVGLDEILLEHGVGGLGEHPPTEGLPRPALESAEGRMGRLLAALEPDRVDRRTGLRRVDGGGLGRRHGA